MEQFIKDGRFHCHTSNSNKDSFMTERQLVQKMKSLGARAVALTDHGNMMGIRAFLDECKKAGINGIPGVEAYVSEHEFEGVSDEPSYRKHLILLAADNIGLHTISLMVTESNRHIELSKAKLNYPLMNKKMIEGFIGEGTPGHGHVIVTSACVGGVLAGKLFESRDAEKKYSEINKKLSIHHEAEKNIKTSEAKISGLQENKTIQQGLAKKTYKAKEKNAMRIKDEEQRKWALLTIEKEKEESAKAAELVKKFTSEISMLKKQVTAYKKNLLSPVIMEQYSKENEKLSAMIMDEKSLKKSLTEEALWYDRTAGHGNFFIELQYHGIAEEKQVMPILSEIAEENSIPVIAANDEHMAEREDYKARKYLNAMRFGNFAYGEMRGDETEYYVKSDMELMSWLCKILPENIVKKAMSNLAVIADRCHVEFKKAPHYPKYDPKLTSEETCRLLESFTRKGVEEKYPDWQNHPEWEARLQHELNVICTMGFADYFLIEQDFLQIGRKIGHMPEARKEWLRKNLKNLTLEEIIRYIEEDQSMPGLTIGPGRGSAAGSIVCYALGITSIDPIRYDLLFERFLNPERVSMPEIIGRSA